MRSHQSNHGESAAPVAMHARARSVPVKSQRAPSPAKWCGNLHAAWWLALLALFAFTACGGDGDDGRQAPPTAGPAPAPSAPPPTGSGSALACYDLDPAPGKTVKKSITYISHAVDGSVSSSATYEEESVVGAEVDFEGHRATETTVVGRSESSRGDVTRYTGKSYASATGPAEFTYFGDITDSDFNFNGGTAASGSTSTVYTPPLVDTSPGLSAGESNTVTASFVQTTSVGGVAQPPIKSTQTHIVTFVGIEPLTIPAGSFDACKFEQRASPGGPASQMWLLVGHGIELKYVEPAAPGIVGETVRELTSLEIDGDVQG